MPKRSLSTSYGEESPKYPAARSTVERVQQLKHDFSIKVFKPQDKSNHAYQYISIWMIHRFKTTNDVEDCMHSLIVARAVVSMLPDLKGYIRLIDDN
uniref:Uncharacterized protein n=1 Tax=Ditylenchus dipsaci TaxID=166011 RepID=A0A915DAD0_9BILA